MKDRFGVSSFCLPDGVSELPGLERTEMERFIDSLSRSEQFDTLILDLDNSVSEVTAMIAERSEIMFVRHLMERIRRKSPADGALTFSINAWKDRERCGLS